MDISKMFGPRPPIKARKAMIDTTKTVGYRPSDLQGRMIASSGVSAGAHPEFDAPTPLDKVVAFAHRLFDKKPNSQKPH